LLNKINNNKNILFPKKMFKEFNSLFQLVIFILYILSIISCQSNKYDLTKVISCSNIIGQKTKDQTPEIKAYSSMMLKCFITITDDEAKEVLVGIERGMKSMEKEDIERLTDFSTLNDIPQDQLKQYSLQLENAIRSIRQLEENRKSGKKYDDDYNDNEEYKKAHPSRGNEFGSFMKKMTGVLKTINNMGNIVIIVIFAYFGLILFKKFCGNNKNKHKDKDKDKDKDKNKNKKKNKKNE